MSLGILILAGGLGKRMNSDLPKVLHKLNDKILIQCVIETANKLNPDKIGIIVGKYKNQIEQSINEVFNEESILSKVEYIIQEEAKGTGHAVQCATDFIKNYNRILVLSGDVPLITDKTLTSMVNLDSKCTILVNELENPTGYGRIKLLEINESNKVKIIEEKDCTDEEKSIKVINSGIYCFESNLLLEYLPRLECNNAQNEYYLTDIVSFYDNVKVIKSYNNNEILGVNTCEQLEQLEQLINTCIFSNDNNIKIKLIKHQFSNTFKIRNNHEVLFRQINTYLINNNIIINNFIDLGAWMGDNTIPWAMNMKNNIIYAIDPSYENCNYIKSMCKLNDINNVNIIKSAISDKLETLYTKDDINHCSFVYNTSLTDYKHKIQSLTLDFLYDKFIIDNIGYIHLDVEGMEYKILQGSINLINDFNPIITFEQHLEIDDTTIIISFLKEKNYIIFFINEILPGCRLDCRNFIAFPLNIYDSNKTIIDNINKIYGNDILLLQ